MKHYGPPILGLCQRYGVRRPDVEDVVQEVLLKLQSSMAKFECRRWLKVVLERSMNDLLTELANSASASDNARIRDALRTPACPARSSTPLRPRVKHGGTGTTGARQTHT